MADTTHDVVAGTGRRPQIAASRRTDQDVNRTVVEVRYARRRERRV
jgi:hypothetical protein